MKSTRGQKFDIATFAEKYALVGGLLVFVTTFSILRPTQFLSLSNFSAILGSQAVLVVLTCALLIPLTAGEYDLSVASTLLLSQMLIGVLNGRDHHPLWLVLLLCLFAGAVIGVINGFFTIVAGIDSLIVTLGIGTLTQGVVHLISSGQTFAGIDDVLSTDVIGTLLFGIPLAFYYGLIVVIAIWYVFEYTPAGRKLLFTGKGPEVARLNGVNTRTYKWSSFVVAGVIASIAGMIYAGTTGAADPVSGTTYLLPAFAAAFLGTTAINPGRFNPFGSLIAVYFLVVGVSGLALFGVQSWVQDVFYGGALVLAVTLSNVARRRRAQTSRL